MTAESEGWVWPHPTYIELEDRVKSLRVRYERLRQALEKIANTEGNVHPSWHVQTAREALGSDKAK